MTKAVQLRRKSASPVLGGVRNGARTLIAMPALAAAGWIAYSNYAIDHNMPLPNAIDAERRSFFGRTAGLLNYYVDAQAGGTPLVFVHSINAAGSSYEFKPLFERYRGKRPVYALDLPGFGWSERSDRIYSPQLYEDAVLDFLSGQVKQPADVVALSLGSEFAARAALAQPQDFRSLTLVSPSGFNQPGAERASQQASRAGSSDKFYRAFSFPLWGRPLYDLIATRRSIRFFLQQSFAGPVDEAMVEYAYATSHQPGAHFAPLYFVSGMLFTRDVREAVYERLTTPVLVIHDVDAFTRFDTLPDVLQRHANWRAARITPTRGLPQFERPEDMVRELDGFWQTLGA
jgi:pimeloyl-ACP methyl ester carboxylesterase